MAKRDRARIYCLLDTIVAQPRNRMYKRSLCSFKTGKEQRMTKLVYGEDKERCPGCEAELKSRNELMARRGHAPFPAVAFGLPLPEGVEFPKQVYQRKPLPRMGESDE